MERKAYQSESGLLSLPKIHKLEGFNLPNIKEALDSLKPVLLTALASLNTFGSPVIAYTPSTLESTESRANSELTAQVESEAQGRIITVDLGSSDNPDNRASISVYDYEGNLIGSTQSWNNETAQTGVISSVTGLPQVNASDLMNNPDRFGGIESNTDGVLIYTAFPGVPGESGASGVGIVSGGDVSVVIHPTRSDGTPSHGNRTSGCFAVNDMSIFSGVVDGDTVLISRNPRYLSREVTNIARIIREQNQQSTDQLNSGEKNNEFRGHTAPLPGSTAKVESSEDLVEQLKSEIEAIKNRSESLNQPNSVVENNIVSFNSRGAPLSKGTKSN